MTGGGGGSMVAALAVLFASASEATAT